MQPQHFQRHFEQLSQLSNLPPHLQQVVINNQRMNKQLVILQREVEEKNSIIRQLKQQVDSGVIQQTQDQLTLARGIQQQVEQHLQSAKHQYVEKSLQMQAEIEVLREEVQQLRDQLQHQSHAHSQLNHQIASLKKYILDIVRDKDYLIQQLGTIINQQEHKISECGYCSKSPQQICRQLNSQPPQKKAPSIRRNQ